MREPRTLANCKLTENSLDWVKFYDELEFRVRSDGGGRRWAAMRVRAACDPFALSHLNRSPT
jgi:hypothetical protein